METKQNLLAQGYKEYHTYADFKKDNLTYESCWVDMAKNKDYSVYVGGNSRNETADQNKVFRMGEIFFPAYMLVKEL